MKISNKAYDVIKIIALNILPPLATLVIALGMIWNIPYYQPISASITAVATFLGAIIGVTSRAYRKSIEEEKNDVL